MVVYIFCISHFFLLSIALFSNCHFLFNVNNSVFSLQSSVTAAGLLHSLRSGVCLVYLYNTQGTWHPGEHGDYLPNEMLSSRTLKTQPLMHSKLKKKNLNKIAIVYFKKCLSVIYLQLYINNLSSTIHSQVWKRGC